MESLLPLASFAFVASITPGPNNVMLAASGIGFGMRRTLPHMLGVSVGFALLLAVCGLGVGALVMEVPAATLSLKIAGSAYLVYLAWTLRGNLGVGADAARSRPMSFAAAAAFQFANPKAWVMAVTCASVFLPDLGSGWQALALLCLVATLVNLPCITTWALIGSGIRNVLGDPLWRRRFSALIVVLTLYAALAIWL